MSDIATLRRIEKIDRTLERLQTAERGMAGGTAFPASPPTGFLFYRSDLGWLCYYDGTRWLTVHEYTITTDRLLTPAAGTIIVTPFHGQYAPYITRRATLLLTGATNTGANYWTIALIGASANQGATSAIDSMNTSAIAGATWSTTSAAPSVSAVPANNAALDLSLTATGAPSVLAQLAIMLAYRLIVT